MATLPNHFIREHLSGAARLLAPLKQRSLELLHLKPGDCVLEVGCGAGADTAVLAHWVGFGGEVWGVDPDPALIAAADLRAVQAGLDSWTRHRLADPAALPLEAGYFDACRSERLLQHLARPEAAVSEMARVTRPGGWIVVAAADYTTLSIDAPDTALERRLMAFQAERLHANAAAGRQLPRLLRRQGLEALQVEIFPLVFTRCVEARELAGLDRLEAHALGEGLLSDSDLGAWRAGLEAAEARAEFFASLNVVLAAGRRP